MTVALCLLGIEILTHIRLKEWNEGYIARKTTIEINGIFVLLVFFSHFCQYLTIPLPFSEGYDYIQRVLKQLVVTTFLFYSGYGVMYCIRHQKEKYIEKLPKKICEMILMFSIAIFIYVGIQFLLGKSYPISQIIYACIGWRSVGNSNWYLFVILLLYAITYICFTIFKDERYALFSVFVFSLLAMVWLKEVQTGTRWYNTFLCYEAGMIFCTQQKRIESFLKASDWTYWIVLIGSIISFVFCYKLRREIVFYELHAILFALIITLLSMKISIDSKGLKWIGERIFGIYILQRIVMILGQNFGLQATPVAYFVFCLVGVFAFAEVFQILSRKARKLL